MKNCCFHYNEEFKQNRFCNLEKLIEYSASAVIFVSSNLCVEPLARTEITFLLLSIWTDELLSTPKITTLLPNQSMELKKVNENQI